ncbi:MAG: hypothetical protein QOH58_1008 [Thermoleophilaceae bacterium]|nr:hypothetical protein [Thermoleophilaceae bacterium]
MATTSSSWARRIGLAIGLLVAVGALLSWRIPAEGAGLGADARFVAVPAGELTVDPAGRFLSARGLRPGGATARGRLAVRNITGGPVGVRLRGLPSSRDLDRPLRVEIAADGTTVFRGRLAALRSWTRAVPLGRGEQRSLEARVWLPAGAGASTVGASVDVTVELRARRARG